MAAKRLPSPFNICQQKDVSKNEDSDREDEAKVRVFAHERGQWSLHVFSRLKNELFCDLKRLVSKFENVRLCSDVHISFNRGYFVTRYHQISSIVDSLLKKISSIPSFVVCLSKAKILENEDNTRVFVCLCDESPDVSTHRILFNRITESVESVFSELASSMKPKVSEAFLIHASLAWCLPGNKNEAISLVNYLNEVIEEPFVTEIKDVTVNIGNRTYTFKLKDA